MVEKKQISEADMAVIRSMDEQLENLIKLHHKVRKDFLRAEAVLLREHGTSERDLKTFVIGVGKALGISEEEISRWRLDLTTGEFVLELPETTPEPEANVVEAEQTNPEPEISEEERILDVLRKKYQRV